MPIPDEYTAVLIKSADGYRFVSNIKQITTHSFSTAINGIPFGLSPAQLVKVINEKGLELVQPNLDEMPSLDFEPVLDGRHYDIDGSFIYRTACGLAFGYTADGENISIANIGNYDLPTAEGLKLGDSIAKIIEIYGDDYDKEAHVVSSVYQYFNGKEYLRIIVSDNVVFRWSILTSGGLNY